MPRVISSDVRTAIWVHHQNGLSGRNYFGQITYAWKLYIKAKTQQKFPGNNVGAAGSDEARKKNGEPVPASSAFSEHRLESGKFHQLFQFLAAASDFAEAERSPHNYRVAYQAGSGDKTVIQAQNSSPVKQDGCSTARKGSPPSQAFHPKQM